MDEEEKNEPTPKPPAQPPADARRRAWILRGAVFAAAAMAVLAGLLLLENIRTRKEEGKQVAVRLVPQDETTTDPAIWGQNFPYQYDSYLRTVDIERTKYGGSEALSKIDADPRLKRMWAGYAFAVEFLEERGHAYMLSDQRETRRVTEFKQKGGCLHCHASVVVPYRKLGVEHGAPGSVSSPLLEEEGLAQLMKGFEVSCAMPYEEATQRAEHPVACIDCHDPQSMALRVTRPGFMNGIQRLAESSDPVPHLPSIERWRAGSRARPYAPNADASRQEMRSLVCGQCHVEYYFHGDGKLLTYPWHNGLKIEQIEAYYDELGFDDWTHAETGAGVLKAQHPEFEMWSQGVHARSGVSCSDCHMPYERQGSVKVSDHRVRSPLLMVDRSCRTCHHFSDAELLARAESIQTRTATLMDRAQNALDAAISDLSAARASGAPDDIIAAAQRLQRRAQFRIDYVNAENSMGFHAPQEATRILGESIDFSRSLQLKLRDPEAEDVFGPFVAPQ